MGAAAICEPRQTVSSGTTKRIERTRRPWAAGDPELLCAWFSRAERAGGFSPSDCRI